MLFFRRKEPNHCLDSWKTFWKTCQQWSSILSFRLMYTQIAWTNSWLRDLNNYMWQLKNKTLKQSHQRSTLTELIFEVLEAKNGLKGSEFASTLTLPHDNQEWPTQLPKVVFFPTPLVLFKLLPSLFQVTAISGMLASKNAESYIDTISKLSCLPSEQKKGSAVVFCFFQLTRTTTKNTSKQLLFQAPDTSKNHILRPSQSQ